MKVIKEALRAKALADTTLTSLLGGEHVYQRWPETMANALTTWVTFWCVSHDDDSELGLANQTYQFDVWAHRSDVGDAVAERLSALYAWKQNTGGGTLSISGRRLSEPVYEEPTSPDLAEPTESGEQLFHKIRQFRVATYPA